MTDEHDPRIVHCDACDGWYKGKAGSYICPACAARFKGNGIVVGKPADLIDLNKFSPQQQQYIKNFVNRVRE